MAARVLLLITCTTLFAAAWESDRPRAARSVAVGVRRQRELNITSADTDFSRCAIPVDLAPGQYRVIDSRGQVGWLIVPPATDQATARRRPDVVTSQSSQGRWHFIRVTNPSFIATTPAETSSRR